MTEYSPAIPPSTLPQDIAAAARAFLCRSGYAEMELRRRLLLRDTVCSSRALAHALTEFAAHAAVHSHDVHCTSHLDADVEALLRALAEWSECVNETAQLLHDICDPAISLGAGQSTSHQEA